MLSTWKMSSGDSIIWAGGFVIAIAGAALAVRSLACLTGGPATLQNPAADVDGATAGRILVGAILLALVLICVAVAV